MLWIVLQNFIAVLISSLKDKHNVKNYREVSNYWKATKQKIWSCHFTGLCYSSQILCDVLAMLSA